MLVLGGRRGEGERLHRQLMSRGNQGKKPEPGAQVASTQALSARPVFPSRPSPCTCLIGPGCLLPLA